MRSLRANLVVFALLATLVPAAVLAVMSFVSYRDITQRSVDQELRLVAHGAAGEIALFARERAHELHALAATPLLADAARSPAPAARERAAAYLRSVHGRLAGFVLLALEDDTGVLARSVDQATDAPASGLRPDAAAAFAAGPPRLDAAGAAPVLTLAVPVHDAAGQRAGMLVGVVDLAPAMTRLTSARTPGGELLLVDPDGVPVSGVPSLAVRAPLRAGDWVALRGDDGTPARYVGADGREMLGVANRVSAVPAWIVAQREREAVLRAWRNVAGWFAVLVAAVAVLMGLLAWWLGRAVVLPLAALTAAADRVAAGQFDVSVPDGGRDEIGRLAHAFSAMTARLRALRAQAQSAQADLTQKNADLERLATTDDLTGLANRKAFDAALAASFAEFVRTGEPFALLLASVDDLDRVNADFGYPAGDEILVDLAALLRQETPPGATAARFAGERFAALIPALPFDAALDLAERIRRRASAPGFVAPRSITVSVGVAQSRGGDAAAETIVFRADHALHEARRAGGNRVRSAM